MNPIRLYDSSGKLLGNLDVRDIGGNRFFGNLTQPSLSRAMQVAFENQDDAINSNTLSILDDFDAILDGFGFEVLMDDNVSKQKVRDIQLSRTGKITLDL